MKDNEVFENDDMDSKPTPSDISVPDFGDIPLKTDNLREQQKKDIKKLLAMLIERDIPIPGGIIDRYIKRISDIDSDVPEELPFN